MVNIKNTVIVLLVVLAVGFIAFRFWPSDERAIRKQLALIEEAGSRDPAEKPVEFLMKSRQIAGLFNDPCELTVEAADYRGVFDRKQIMDRITLVRSSFNRVIVDLYDISIDFPEKQTAAVSLTLRLRSESGSDTIADVHEVAATLRKIEGTWLVTSVRIVEVLER